MARHDHGGHPSPRGEDQGRAGRGEGQRRDPRHQGGRKLVKSQGEDETS